jgi:hypothetical protein
MTDMPRQFIVLELNRVWDDTAPLEQFDNLLPSGRRVWTVDCDEDVGEDVQAALVAVLEDVVERLRGTRGVNTVR